MRFARTGFAIFLLYKSQVVLAQVNTTDANVTQEVIPPNCYDSLNDLNAAFKQRENVFEVVDYILCANTVFELGVKGETLDETIEIQDDLSLRKNSRILCGVDGKRSNNCRLRGGFRQIASWQHTYDEVSKENVYISGLTFDSGNGYGGVFVSQGDITFVDCLFINHRNNGALQFLYTSDEDAEARDAMEEAAGGNRKLVADMDDHQAIVAYYNHILDDPKAMEDYKKRSLQTVAKREVYVATFDNCVFEQNSFGQERGVTQTHGVITLVTPSTRLIVKNSVFHENDFGDEEITLDTHCIEAVALAEIELENNCFLLNDLVGKGAVNVQYPEQILVAKNNFGTLHHQLDCQFIHIYNDGNTSCIDFDLDSCPLDFEFESVAPTMSPVTKSRAVPQAATALMGTIASMSISALVWFCL